MTIYLYKKQVFEERPKSFYLLFNFIIYVNI